MDALSIPDALMISSMTNTSATMSCPLCDVGELTLALLDLWKMTNDA
jgi:hypothetical protein